ncbi:DUF3885 domain-containing protein [Deinococcus ficus]|uniref:DUF3885 domain-containing protein n=1 Tax=Deinococcus ficus TaxID=317577 RepID=A0A221SV26_9DEIO|nr:DUF3885 domain-containing protein [Deinococcus ficus]ASN80490.1 hypothetical protein DFI_05265 [Deinococcus ficus]
MLLSRVFDVFGPAAVGHAVFYHHEPALRFELAGGETVVDRFSQAYDRARLIASRAFERTERVTVVLATYVINERTAQTQLSRSARSCGVAIPRKRESVLWPSDDAGNPARLLMAFEMDVEAVPRLLWGVLAREVGVRPRLDGALYLADLDHGILVHPYDDRGMDVIGPNTERIAMLYREFQAWRLAYDHERMEGFFS